MSKPQSGKIVDVLEVKTVHTNLTQEIIKITADKLKLILLTHLQNMERRRDWIAPLGILLTLLVVFPTTEFKLVAGIKAETWLAVFMIAGFLVFCWLVKTALAALRSPSVEDVIEQIKHGA